MIIQNGVIFTKLCNKEKSQSNKKPIIINKNFSRLNVIQRSLMNQKLKKKISSLIILKKKKISSLIEKYKKTKLMKKKMIK